MITGCGGLAAEVLAWVQVLDVLELELLAEAAEPEEEEGATANDDGLAIISGALGASLYGMYSTHCKSSKQCGSSRWWCLVSSPKWQMALQSRQTDRR